MSAGAATRGSLEVLGVFQRVQKPVSTLSFKKKAKKKFRMVTSSSKRPYSSV